MLEISDESKLLFEFQLQYFQYFKIIPLILNNNIAFYIPTKEN